MSVVGSALLGTVNHELAKVETKATSAFAKLLPKGDGAVATFAQGLLGAGSFKMNQSASGLVGHLTDKLS